ncbi:amidohydrolase family protein [Cognatitamlana onchidii]|uniref:amidohydrolase family protein n=1 Tax=Cognatitamlana onchidii TaxID=2562860 RepID=UPI0010A62EE6|nr:amidohydrolase family protein [Algibacter onchidii]
MKYMLQLALMILMFNHVLAQKFTPQVQKFIAIDTSIVAITNTTLIDGTGAPIKHNQTIILKDKLILEVGNSEQIEIPEMALIIDGTNKTVIPGLVMMHEHLFYTKFFEDWFSIGQMSFTFPRLYLAGGVTTMRTAGSIQPQSDLNVKKWIKEGKMTGPKMDVTSPFIERAGSPIAELGFIENTSEVSEIVNFWAKRGVTSFKLYNRITQEDMVVCIEEAHKRNLKVTGHLCSVTYEEASNLGIDNLEHGFMASTDFMANKVVNQCDPFEARQSLNDEPIDSPRVNKLIDLLIQNGTTITTTPNVFEPWTNRELIPGGGELAVAPDVLQDVKNIYDRLSGKDSLHLVRFNKNLIWLKRFYDQGGKLMAGTDPTGAGRTVAGYANRRTIEILVEAGFPLQDVIKICTLNGAIYLEQDEQIGTVEKGKIADLILISGNLEDHIKNIRNMELVFKEGIGFNSKLMFESVKGKVGLN